MYACTILATLQMYHKAFIPWQVMEFKLIGKPELVACEDFYKNR